MVVNIGMYTYIEKGIFGKIGYYLYSQQFFI